MVQYLCASSYFESRTTDNMFHKELSGLQTLLISGFMIQQRVPIMSLKSQCFVIIMKLTAMRNCKKLISSILSLGNKAQGLANYVLILRKTEKKRRKKRRTEAYILSPSQHFNSTASWPIFCWHITFHFPNFMFTLVIFGGGNSHVIKAAHGCNYPQFKGKWDDLQKEMVHSQITY